MRRLSPRALTSLLLLALSAGCGSEATDCALERCEVWSCGTPRPACPCGELCERPQCSEVTVYARDPDSGRCQELATVCDVPDGWERFWDLEACEGGARMCRSGADCGALEVCDIRSCVADDTGTCVERPEACLEGEDPPVVDCEGRSYASDCERLQAGARLEGELSIETTACTAFGVWAQDPVSGACSYFANDCYAPEGWPFFFARQECEGPSCSDGPVWALDGAGACVEYESDCDVPVGAEFFDRLASCEVGGGGLCELGAGGCEGSMVCDARGCSEDPTPLGQCVPMPEGCEILPEAPNLQVCGCDGVTYEVDCERLIAGVALAYSGPCGAL